MFKVVKDSHKPIFVCTNNTPEAVVLSFEEFQNMQEIVEFARREQLGHQMVCDLLDIAQLTSQPIKPMLLTKTVCLKKQKGKSMSIGDIYRIFVRFDSDTFDGKGCYTVGIGKTNLTVVLLDSIISQYKAIKMSYHLKIMQSYFQPICRNGSKG
nr:hypothetical protein [Acinetobacter soli]